MAEQHSDPLRDAAIRAASAALRPIVALLLDAGVSPNDLTRLIRRSFVDEAASRQRVTAKKVSISRIAAVTGLSRAEVSHVLSEPTHSQRDLGLSATAAERVISGWISDPDFLDPRGAPLRLPYSDGTPSFSDLTRRYSPDIPPRAMLTELVVAKRLIASDDGTYEPAPASLGHSLSRSDAYLAFGRKLNALGRTLLRNIRDNTTAPLFETFIVNAEIPLARIPRVRRDIERRCKSFSHGITRFLLDQSVASPEAQSYQAAPPPVGVIIAIVEGPQFPEADDHHDIEPSRSA